MDSVRIDKYLWAIRVFKTRTESADACNGNKVKIGGVNAKASKAVKIGDVLEIRKGPVQLTYKILQLTENRMGASLVPDFAMDLTPESEKAKMHVPRETVLVSRDKGSGRPTKKERRTLDALMDSFDD
ncbi:MAG: RNA-binding S4 domain-containing protein [Bacteroidales bacterium]|nr:RNA-binding S4 domain-containing protein [Bacteroidales bacterium]